MAISVEDAGQGWFTVGGLDTEVRVRVEDGPEGRRFTTVEMSGSNLSTDVLRSVPLAVVAARIEERHRRAAVVPLPPRSHRPSGPTDDELERFRVAYSEAKASLRSRTAMSDTARALGISRATANRWKSLLDLHSELGRLRARVEELEAR